MIHPRQAPVRAAPRTLAFLALLAAAGCGQRETPPAVEPAPLAFAPVATHPAGGHLPAQDVAVWRQPAGLDQYRYYAAVGSAGIMVHLADGAFLQRLAHSAASRVGVLYAVPVDEAVADFLVALDPANSRLDWFEINAGSGALRRLAGRAAEIGVDVGGLCTHDDARAGSHRVLVVTRSGELQEWAVVARSGRQPNFANHIVATLIRTLPLGGAGGACAVDREGNVFVVVNGRDLRRVNPDWTMAAAPVMRSGAPQSLEGAVAAVDLAWDGAGRSLLLIADQDGRRLVASDPSGRILATTSLGHPVSALRSGGDSLAIVTEGGEVRLGAWSNLSAGLGIRGAPVAGAGSD